MTQSRFISWPEKFCYVRQAIEIYRNAIRMINDRPFAVFVFARGGSKGIKDKNLQEIGGVPLVGHSVLAGLALPGCSNVYLSSDSDRILECGSSYGAVPIKRPTELSQDNSAELYAWRHAVSHIKSEYNDCIDYFISLPPTGPLRSLEKILEAQQLYLNSSRLDCVVAVTEAVRHPEYNLLKELNGLVTPYSYSGKIVSGRQKLTKAYDMTTNFLLMNAKNLFETEHLFDRNIGFVLVERSQAIDIDDQYDLDLARWLFEKRSEEVTDE